MERPAPPPESGPQNSVVQRTCIESDGVDVEQQLNWNGGSILMKTLNGEQQLQARLRPD